MVTKTNSSAVSADYESVIFSEEEGANVCGQATSTSMEIVAVIIKDSGPEGPPHPSTSSIGNE